MPILRIQLRRGLATSAAANNPILGDGEIGLETDTKKAKVGDGLTHWNDLQYWDPSGAGGSSWTTPLANEVTRATSAENTLSGAISTETTRATTAENGKVAKAGDTMTGKLAPKVTALADGSSVPLDASQGNVYDWSLGAANHTLAAPTNPTNGQPIRIRIAYGGAFTPLFNAAFHFGTDGQPTWTATNGKVDVVGFEYDTTITAWLCMGWKLGF